MVKILIYLLTSFFLFFAGKPGVGKRRLLKRMGAEELYSDDILARINPRVSLQDILDDFLVRSVKDRGLFTYIIYVCL